MTRSLRMGWTIGLSITLLCAGRQICRAAPKGHLQGQAQSCPVIWEIYVAYRTVDTGGINRAFPFDDDSVAMRAIIIASTDGVNKAAYTLLDGAPADFRDGSKWNIEGTQGVEHAANVSFGYNGQPPFHYRWLNDLSSSFDTVKAWRSEWGTTQNGNLVFTWTNPTDACIEKCSTDCPGGSGAHRRYQFTDESSTLVGWGTNGRYLDWGTMRYKVKVSYLPPGMPESARMEKESRDKAEATRISVRDHRNYGIVVPSDEPAKSDAERRLRLLQWIHAYANVPYEFGGSWFGGRIQDPLTECVGGCDPCELYGIDCSHTVCVGAKWAGYNWSTGAEGGYYYYTGALAGSYCAEDISDRQNLSDMVHGDIENWAGHHVRAIIDYDPGNHLLTCIAAEPQENPDTPPRENRVREVTVDWTVDRARIDAQGRQYMVRHLIAH